jgi:hypothetical protein
MLFKKLTELDKTNFFIYGSICLPPTLTLTIHLEISNVRKKGGTIP